MHSKKSDSSPIQRDIDSESKKPRLDKDAVRDNPCELSRASELVLDRSRSGHLPFPDIAPWVQYESSFVERSRSSESTFTPDCRSMFYILRHSYEVIASSPKFSDHKLSCTWPVIYYYYALAFYLRVMLVMKKYDTSPSHDNQRIMSLFLAFPLEKWKIASPLLSVFQSLCVFEPSDPMFGPVLPWLPPRPPLDADGTGRLEDPYICALPCMVTAANLVKRTLMAKSPNMDIPEFEADIASTTATATADSTTTVKDLNLWKNIIPNFQVPYHCPTASAKLRNVVAHRSKILDRFNTHDMSKIKDIKTWGEYLLLDDRFKDLGYIIQQATIFASAFESSISLDAIPLVNGREGSVVCSHHPELILPSFSLPEKAPVPDEHILHPFQAWRSLPIVSCVREPLVRTDVPSHQDGITRNELITAVVGATHTQYPKGFTPKSHRLNSDDPILTTRTGSYWKDAHVRAHGSRASRSNDLGNWVSRICMLKSQR